MPNPDESTLFGAIILAATPADASPADPDLFGLDRYGLPLHGWVIRTVRDAGIERCLVLHDGCLDAQAAQWAELFPGVGLQDVRTTGLDDIARWVGPAGVCSVWLDANRPGLNQVHLRELTSTCTGSDRTALRISVGSDTASTSSPGGTSASVAACLNYDAASKAIEILLTSAFPPMSVAALATRLEEDGISIDSISGSSPAPLVSVHCLLDWVNIGDVLRQRILQGHIATGVVVVDPDQVWIDADVRIGPGTILFPGVSLTGRTVVGAGCRIGPFVVADDAAIGDRSSVGPFAHLRKGTVLGETVRIGNFVEVKNSVIHPGSAAGHLTYLGDAEVGAGTNIGAGTITCNYDGVSKHRTRIGDGAFVGSHSTLVAPVSIGDGAWTAAGSVVTKDVPAESLAVGRARQENRDGWAKARRDARSGKESGK